jgi:hypothetical protein
MSTHAVPAPRASRRDLLRAAAVGLAPVLATAIAEPGPARRDLIRAENEKPGTTDWMLRNVRVDPKTKYRCPWVEGYCSRNSVRPGESLSVMVSTNPPSPFVLDVYRLGYYNGKGGRHLARLGSFKGRAQPEAEVRPLRLRECRWEPSVQLEIARDWPSGVYLGKLTAEKENIQSYIIFIVRDDRACDFLFQCSDTTWAAYNRWPDRWSLYDDDKTGWDDWYTGPGVSAGWDRPYGKYRQVVDAPLSLGSGEFLLWEFPLAFWMEKHSYDVSYVSNVDTHADAAGLRRAKAFLSVGHDEYWSLEMFRNVKAALEAGVHAAFFSGNAVDGVVALHANGNGAANRWIERVGTFGGALPDRRAREEKHAARWKQHGPDPRAIMGARTTLPANGWSDWTCVREKHWLFAGTGMKNGDKIPGLVGWEHHGEPADVPGLEVVARGPVTSHGKPQGVDYTSVVFPGPKGNIIFNAATIWWSDGLSHPPAYVRPSAHGKSPPGPDQRVQRMTANLFDRFRGAGG